MPDIESEWEPEIKFRGRGKFKFGASADLQMRKRGGDGRWIYREPTQQEIEEYLANEGW
jgi:hypothetical protein